VTVYRFDEMVMLLVNGTARTDAWQHLVRSKRGTVRLRDISDDVAVIAVRGPRTVSQLTPHLKPMPMSAGDVRFAHLAGVGVFAARTTIDGPDGFDLYTRGRDLPTLGDALSRLGIPMVSDAMWHVMRLERGIARFGIEIDPGDTPVEAGLEHLVAQGKGASFPGEAAFAERLRHGAMRRLVGFTVAGTEVPPVGAVVSAAGRAVDRVRSVDRSPRAGVIGMTAVPLGADTPGTALRISDNGREWQATVVATPFVSDAEPRP
jgi:glycine cleavage system aminomethyltransferase T